MDPAKLSTALSGFAERMGKSEEIEVTQNDIFHSALTTGLGLTPFGSKPRWAASEFAWKLPMIDALLSAEGGRWKRPSDSDWLDPSEKNALAYLISNVQTGIVARKLFGATHVAHLSKLDRRSYTRDKGGRMIPDFAALDVLSRKSFVIETKGSFQRVSSQSIDKGLKQLSTRISFRGYPNPLRYVHVSEFSSYEWQSRLIRAPGPSIRRVASVGGALYAYYQPVLELLLGMDATAKDDYLTAEVGSLSLGLKISIAQELRRIETSDPAMAIIENSQKELSERFERLESVVQDEAIRSEGLALTNEIETSYPDGFRVSSPLREGR